MPRCRASRFERLIEANRVDQRVARYETWEQLLGYCQLSADPVGELVLAALDRATPERVALSNGICTALQLAEHWQDVAEDLARGRVYLPATDLERFGCGERELREPRAGWRVRGLVAFEVARTRELLEQGAPLLGTLRGRERVAVAGVRKRRAGGARGDRTGRLRRARRPTTRELPQARGGARADVGETGTD